MTEGSNRFDASDPMMALNNRFFRRYRDNHRRPLEPSSLDSVRHPDLDRAAVSELSGGGLSDSGGPARSRHRANVASARRRCGEGGEPIGGHERGVTAAAVFQAITR